MERIPTGLREREVCCRNTSSRSSTGSPCLLCAIGCQSKSEPVPETVSRPVVPLRVSVFDSDEFAQRVKAGWEGTSEQNLEVMIAADQSINELAENSDVVVFPSHLLGQAATDRLITPLPEKFLSGASLSSIDFLLQLGPFFKFMRFPKQPGHLNRTINGHPT